MRSPMAIAAVVFLASGQSACGVSSPDTRDPRQTASTALAAGAAGNSEANVVRDVTYAYFEGLARRDWKAVCATRPPAERVQLAKVAGTCPKAFEAIARKTPGLVEEGGRVTLAGVRIRGNVAGIDVIHSGLKSDDYKMAATKVGGRWYVTTIPDAQIP